MYKKYKINELEEGVKYYWADNDCFTKFIRESIKFRKNKTMYNDWNEIVGHVTSDVYIDTHFVKVDDVQGKTGMNFIEALKAAKNGKTIRRKCWYGHPGFILFNNKLVLSSNGSSGFDYNDTHIEATDWESINEYIEVKLNSEYAAKIYKDKIVVGCQEFPISKLQELVEASKKVS